MHRLPGDLEGFESHCVRPDRVPAKLGPDPFLLTAEVPLEQAASRDALGCLLHHCPPATSLARQVPCVPFLGRACHGPGVA